MQRMLISSKRSSRIRMWPVGARWCAWQESNLLPLAPQASALSGELQARAVQFSRASTAVVAVLNVFASRLVTTTKATKTDLCQQASRTGERSYVQALIPSPVGAPRASPGTTSPAGGGTKPKIPACHARSASPGSEKTTTKLAAPLMLELAASSAVQAAGSAANSEMAASLAPAF